MIPWSRLLQERFAAAATQRAFSPTEQEMDEQRRTARTTRLDLIGWQVDCCCIADDARLLFLYPPDDASEISGFELSLRTPFQLQVADRNETMADPTGPREALGPLLALYGRCVRDARVSDEGALELEFADGAWLCAEPDLVYEAWALRGPHQEELVCLPGGDGVVAFAPERSTSRG
jgi:Family of unknown function (DUF6188)